MGVYITNLDFITMSTIFLNNEYIKLIQNIRLGKTVADYWQKRQWLYTKEWVNHIKLFSS